MLENFECTEIMEAAGFNTFVGFVPDLKEESVCVGIVDTLRKEIFTEKFPLRKSTIEDIESYYQKKEFDSDFFALRKFLNEKILNPKNTRFLVEVPSAILDENSIQICKLLIFLSMSRYCEFEYRFLESRTSRPETLQAGCLKHFCGGRFGSYVIRQIQKLWQNIFSRNYKGLKSRVRQAASQVETSIERFIQIDFPYIILGHNDKEPQINYVPEELIFHGLKNPGLSSYGVLYIQKGVSEAYANFLLGHSSPKVTSICAGLIARNANLHRFFNSIGVVQSSQDILEYMKSSQEEPTAVVSSYEAFITAKVSETIYDDLDKIPLKYAVARKKNFSLGEINALKFALLKVCKLWNIRLSCMPIEADTGNVDYFQLFSKQDFIIFNPNSRADQFVYNFFEKNSD